MTMRVIGLLLFIVCTSLVSSLKFYVQNAAKRRSSTCVSSQAGMAGSYQQMLQRAKSGDGAPAAPVTARSTIQQQEPPLEAPIPSLKGNPNGLPFSDEVYEHLRFAIEKISGRMKSDKALSWEDIGKLKASIDRIVLDAHIPNVAVVTRSTAPAPMKQSAVSSFDDDADEISAVNSAKTYGQPKADNTGEAIPGWMGDMAGKGSSWNVPGMQNMDIEQYYAAINQRITDMKNKRKAAGEWDPEPGGSYLDSINKRNRSG